MPMGEAVSMVSENGNHMYSADNQTYPSVTTVLDVVAYNKSIVKWANGLGLRRLNYEDELLKSATLGTYVHEIAQCLVDPEHGKMPVIKDPLVDYYVRKRIANLKYQLDQHKDLWKTVWTETPFVSHTYQLGGTMDWMCEWGGKLTLMDYKTSSGLRDKHILQLGGYHRILQDNGIDIEGAAIVLIRQDRCLLNFFNMDTINRAAEIFLQVKDYYYAHEELSRMVLEAPQIIDISTTP